MKPLELFSNKQIVYVCAPMVRYSKLSFRRLVRKYDCDLCFTPMIIADSFIKSEKARHSDFTYSSDDNPLIVQFAANNSQDFAQASLLVKPYSDGVDLNCGCPQRWAMKLGYGACLIDRPEKVADVIRQTRNAVLDNDFTISLKIRIHKDVRETVDFARKMESAGASFVTVHGRTKDEVCEAVHYDAIAAVKSALRIPVIANGDAKNLKELTDVHTITQVNGVMAARGLLANPAMFCGAEVTPLECVLDWIQIALETGTSFSCFHNHLIYMIERSLARADRRVFNSLTSVPSVLSYLEQKYDIRI